MKNKIIVLLFLLSCSSTMVSWNILTPFQLLHSSIKGIAYGDPDAKIGTCYDACKHDHTFGRFNPYASAKLSVKTIEGGIYGFLLSKAIEVVSSETGRTDVGWLAIMLAMGYVWDMLSELQKSQVPVAHDAQKNLGDHMVPIDVCTKNGHMYFDSSKLKFSRTPFKLATVAVAFAALPNRPRQHHLAGMPLVVFVPAPPAPLPAPGP